MTKESGAGVKVETEQLEVENVSVTALQRVLTVQGVSLPKASVRMSLPNEPTKLSIELDNNAISGLRLEAR